MKSMLKHLSLGKTPQSQPIPGRETEMVENDAGGFSFESDPWQRALRFLVIGTEGGTYYRGEASLTKQNAKNLLKCAREDGPRLVKLIVDVSASKPPRAPKNDQCIFALALCCKLGTKGLGPLGGADNANAKRTRTAAYAALPQVARIGTHLYQWVDAINDMGWGSGAKRAVARWFNEKEPADLAYQAFKYPSRKVGGTTPWTFRDVLRQAHVVPEGELREQVVRYMIEQGKDGATQIPHEWSEDEVLSSVYYAEEAKRSDSVKRTIQLIEQYGLPREVVKTEHLNNPKVWDALLHAGKYGMPMTAMIRNLGKMSAVGLLSPMSEASKFVVNRIGDAEALKHSRIHPFSILVAHVIYGQGKGEKGKLSWTPVQQVVDALSRSFYASFGNVESTGKNVLLAIDVSGSMDGYYGAWGGVSGKTYTEIAGTKAITPRIAAAAMALITANVEPNHHFVGFSHELIDLPISPSMRLDSVVQAMSRIPFGRTDCALPMIHAQKRGWDIDAFCVYTDNETWFGNIHPTQALANYRKARNPKAVSAVVAMTGCSTTIADPNDPGMLDLVGFDTATPNLISQFVTGQL